jgi:hypothetical protein
LLQIGVLKMANPLPDLLKTLPMGGQKSLILKGKFKN